MTKLRSLPLLLFLLFLSCLYTLRSQVGGKN